jgi:hypothetical protein
VTLSVSQARRARLVNCVSVEACTDDSVPEEIPTAFTLNASFTASAINEELRPFKRRGGDRRVQWSGAAFTPCGSREHDSDQQSPGHGRAGPPGGRRHFCLVAKSVTNESMNRAITNGTTLRTAVMRGSTTPRHLSPKLIPTVLFTVTAKGETYPYRVKWTKAAGRGDVLGPEPSGDGKTDVGYLQLVPFCGFCAQ